MHNVTLGNDFTSASDVKKGFPIIEDNVIIGTGAIIIGRRKIGRDSIIGAGSVITEDIPPNSIAYVRRKIIIKSKT